MMAWGSGWAGQIISTLCEVPTLLVLAATAVVAAAAVHAASNSSNGNSKLCPRSPRTKYSTVPAPAAGQWRSKRGLNATLRGLPSPSALRLHPAAAALGSDTDTLGVQLKVDDVAALEALVSRWGVTRVGATALTSGGFKLQSRDADWTVETAEVVVRRTPSLGIELGEVANNGAGVGIVIIEGLVKGGNAEAVGALRLGDVICGIGAEPTKDERAPAPPMVNTECLTYDDLVDVLGAIPDEWGNSVRLLVRRLVRRAAVSVTVQFPDSRPDETIKVYSGENLRRALLTRGVKINDPLAERFDSGGTGDCGAEGTCCTCAVEVVRGQDTLSSPSIQEAKMLEPRPRWRLACKARVVTEDDAGSKDGDLVIKVNPRQFKK